MFILISLWHSFKVSFVAISWERAYLTPMLPFRSIFVSFLQGFVTSCCLCDSWNSSEVLWLILQSLVTMTSVWHSCNNEAQWTLTGMYTRPPGVWTPTPLTARTATTRPSDSWDRSSRGQHWRGRALGTCLSTSVGSVAWWPCLPPSTNPLCPGRPSASKYHHTPVKAALGDRFVSTLKLTINSDGAKFCVKLIRGWISQCKKPTENSLIRMKLKMIYKKPKEIKLIT